MADRQILKTLALVLFLGIISAATQFYSPNVADPDSFYHIKHAYIYRTGDLFDTSFPWAQYSLIKKTGADLWWGFHILLLPFTYFDDLILGIKTAGAFVTLATLLSFAWALSRLKIRWPFVWPLLFLAAGPDVMYRLSMARPHNVSLALGLLVFSFLLNGRWANILIASAALVFIHPAMSWLPLLMTVAVSLANKIYARKIEWPKALAALGGIAVGLLARPHPLGTLQLMYAQTVGIALAKINHIPLLFGKEIIDFDFRGSELTALLQNALPALIILAISWGLFKTTPKRDQPGMESKSLITASLIVAAVFMFISMAVARRGYDYTIVFVLIAASAFFNVYLRQNRIGGFKLLTVAVLTIAVLLANTLPTFAGFMEKAVPPDHLKEVSLWLKNNTKPGEIVFNTRWDLFHGLFFWNTQDHYINGMDPIFMYGYDPTLYWKNHYLAIDKADRLTCGKIRCTPEEAESTHAALVNDFKASYLLVRLFQNPKLYFYLVNEGKFPLVFDNQKEAVFKIPPL